MNKNILTTIASILLIVLSSITVYGQQRKITGVVVDGIDNTQLPGAVVKIKGTNIGASTDANGKFTLAGEFKSTDVLVVSFIGYLTSEKTIGDLANFTILLKPDAQTLGEVIVTGVATGTSKTKLGFAVDKVNLEALQKVPGGDPATALQGKVAGLSS